MFFLIVTQILVKSYVKSSLNLPIRKGTKKPHKYEENCKFYTWDY